MIIIAVRSVTERIGKITKIKEKDGKEEGKRDNELLKKGFVYKKGSAK